MLPQLLRILMHSQQELTSQVEFPQVTFLEGDNKGDHEPRGREATTTTTSMEE